MCNFERKKEKKQQKKNNKKPKQQKQNNHHLLWHSLQIADLYAFGGAVDVLLNFQELGLAQIGHARVRHLEHKRPAVHHPHIHVFAK